MVSPGDALPYRAHEEDRPLNARAPRTDSQLFPCSEVAFQRRRRRPEQQSQSHTEKILRIPHFPLPRTRALSLTWQAAGTGVHPRVFLTNHISSRSAVRAPDRFRLTIPISLGNIEVPASLRSEP